MLRVGTGNIQLVGRDPLTFVQNLDRPFIVLARVTEHVAKDYDVFELPQVREFLFEECSSADVLQADRIQHARRSLPQTRRRIPYHRLSRKSLHHEAAELAQMHYIFKLDAVAESAARRNHRILELNSRKAHAEIRSRVSGIRWRSRHFLSAAAGIDECFGAANASVNTRPTECVGALMPSNDAKVAARSIGSECVRYVPGWKGSPYNASGTCVSYVYGEV